MADNNATESLSRRNVRKAAGGLLAGSTPLARLGARHGVAAIEEGLHIEARETNEEYIAIRAVNHQSCDPNGPPISFLGHAERFVIHEDSEWVSQLEEEIEA